MREIKFLHFSDMHLDMPFTSLGGNSRILEARRQDLLRVFKKIIGIASSEDTDLLLIGGDLYEHDYVRKSTINFINDCFESIPDTKVVIVPGNHDPYTSDSYYRTFKWNENVYMLHDDRPFIEFDDKDLCICGDSFTKHRHTLKRNQINILLSHATLDMSFGNRMYNPLESSYLDSLDMDYIALGHFHKRYEAMGRRGSIYNPGSPEPLGFDEIGEHGVFTGSIKKDSTGERSVSIRFVKTNERSYENIEIRLDGSRTDEQAENKIWDKLSEKDLCNTLFKVTLCGYVEAGYKADVDLLKSRLSEKVLFVKLKDETVPEYDFDSLSAEPGLKGLFVQKMRRLLESAESPKQKDIYTRALYYGIEALEQGEVKI